MTKILVTFLILFYSNVLMAATAIVQNASGDVKAVMGSDSAFVVTQNSTLENGMTVMTGDSSQVVMKFEDGQIVALNSNTAFKINQYHFEQAAPVKNNIVFSLLKGAMRAVSGLIAKNNPDAFMLQTPTATIGIRGTDFMAATGSLYLQVVNGMVSATNAAGTIAFTAGQTGFVASLSALPAMITTAQLPAAVASSFSQLGSVAMGAAGGVGSAAGTGGAAGGTAATGAAVGGLSTVAVVGTAAAVAAVAALATSNNNTAATTTVTQ